MTDLPRCEPPAGLREVRGWHWLRHKGVRVDRPFEWQPWKDDMSSSLWAGLGTPDWCIGRGWTYDSPCPAPEEIAGLVSAGRAACYQLSLSEYARDKQCATALAAELARFPQTGERG